LVIRQTKFEGVAPLFIDDDYWHIYLQIKYFVNIFEA
jgi:hypothetical protein